MILMIDDIYQYDAIEKISAIDETRYKNSLN